MHRSLLILQLKPNSVYEDAGPKYIFEIASCLLLFAMMCNFLRETLRRNHNAPREHSSGMGYKKIISFRASFASAL